MELVIIMMQDVMVITRGDATMVMDKDGKLIRREIEK